MVTPNEFYLVQLAVSAIEDELERHIRTILNSGDAGGREVEVNAE